MPSRTFGIGNPKDAAVCSVLQLPSADNTGTYKTKSAPSKVDGRFLSCKRCDTMNCMRISQPQVALLKREIQDRIPQGRVYVFGSRTNDSKRGGDVDILVVGTKHLSILDRIKVRTAFFRAYGMQKVDIVSVTAEETSAFRDAVLRDAVEI